MKKIMAFAAFLFLLCLGLPARAQSFALESARALKSVAAVELSVYTFDTKGRYVDLGWTISPLTAPQSREDLANQLSWLGDMECSSRYTGRVFVDAYLLDDDGFPVLTAGNSFLPERFKRKGKRGYEAPYWGTNDFSFTTEPAWYVFDGDPKTKKVAEWDFTVSFQWVDFVGIDRMDPDIHQYVTVLGLAPEWGPVSIVESHVGKADTIRVYARSVSGFKPKWVRVTSYDRIDIDLPEPVEYIDRMRIDVDPGEVHLLEFIFDQDPAGSTPPSGGKG